MRMPSLLRAGDRVAVIATSGPCDIERLACGVQVIKDMGLVPEVMESCYLRHGYLAGVDDVRLRDLHMAFADPCVKGVFVARGGYGAGRLLSMLDYDLIRYNPKVFVGYSDVTALHIAITQRCGFITFHGPMPAADFGRGVEAFTLGSLKSMVFSPLGGAGAKLRQKDGPIEAVLKWNDYRSSLPINPPGRPLFTIVPGYATGPLTGGNLSLLAASIGTPYELDTRGRILFIEETGEDPYRIDRMLLQLKQAGKLSDAGGIILGDFGPQTLESLHICINELIVPEKKPTLAGLAFGHTSPNLTLPVGGIVELDLLFHAS